MEDLFIYWIAPTQFLLVSLLCRVEYRKLHRRRANAIGLEGRRTVWKVPRRFDWPFFSDC
ncbi:hypothetical protein DWB84_01810 [Saccharophagus sp. K07]|nr:hypothetical protein [Saccharophagus sp. K07]